MPLSFEHDRDLWSEIRSQLESIRASRSPCLQRGNVAMHPDSGGAIPRAKIGPITDWPTAMNAPARRDEPFTFPRSRPAPSPKRPWQRHQPCLAPCTQNALEHRALQIILQIILVFTLSIRHFASCNPVINTIKGCYARSFVHLL